MFLSNICCANLFIFIDEHILNFCGHRLKDVGMDVVEPTCLDEKCLKFYKQTTKTIVFKFE